VSWKFHLSDNRVKIAKDRLVRTYPLDLSTEPKSYIEDIRFHGDLAYSARRNRLSRSKARHASLDWQPLASAVMPYPSSTLHGLCRSEPLDRARFAWLQPGELPFVQWPDKSARDS
jgi:hypothetical protein